MSEERPSKIGMKPPHPGDFIRTEILEELHLSIARAAEILGISLRTVRNKIRDYGLPSRSAYAND